MRFMGSRVAYAKQVGQSYNTGKWRKKYVSELVFFGKNSDHASQSKLRDLHIGEPFAQAINK
jgi:hypothetical protein